MPCYGYQRIPFLPPPFHLHFSLFTIPYLSIAAMADQFTHVREFPIHDGQSIDVVYTNDLVEVQRNLDMYESMLEGRDPADRFMGLDLEYTSDGPNHEFAQLVVVVQICLHKKVLVFQYSRYVKHPYLVISVRPTSSH